MSVAVSSRSIFENEEILVQLDQCFLNYRFPMLDHGHVYLAATRMHGYRDENRWIILIERLGYNNRGGGHNGIQNDMYFFGNCLDFYPGDLAGNILFPTSDSPAGATFDHLFQEFVRPKVSSIMIRDREVPFPKDAKKYKEWGIELSDPPRIYAYELLRWLAENNLDDLLAYQEEIRHRIPKDIPHFFTLGKWNHPCIAKREKPSQSQTFRQIANAMQTGDFNKITSPDPPNTHWSHWPLGGTL